MTDELQQHLDLLARDACYRVDVVLRESPNERTERVFFVGANGAERGPYVRKTIKAGSGLGEAYGRIFEAQRAGVRLACLPRIEERYDVGADHVVVMEYVAGETLAQLVERVGPSPAIGCEVMPKVCDAVSQLHAAFDPPLIHRDLKPGNVMLSGGTPVLIDFGIARTYKEGSESDTRHFGTRAYAPPEQFGFGQTDVRSDVYALGMLLWFCLTGKDPDAASRVGGYAHPAIPEPLREVVSIAGSLDPAARYQSAGEMARALRKAARLCAATQAEEAPDPFVNDLRFTPPLFARRLRCTARASAAAFDAASASSPKADAPGLVPEPASEAPHGSAALPPTTGSRPPCSASERLLLPGTSSGFGGATMGPLRKALDSKTVRRLGVAWDILLLLCVVLLTLGAVGALIDPPPGSPQGERSLAYGISMTVVMLLLFIYPIAFLLADKRPIRRLIPALPPMTPKRYAVVAIVCLALISVSSVAIYGL